MEPHPRSDSIFIPQVSTRAERGTQRECQFRDHSAGRAADVKAASQPGTGSSAETELIVLARADDCNALQRARSHAVSDDR